MAKKPDVADTMRQSEMNLLAAQTERFDEYRRWVGFRLMLGLIMLMFLIALDGWRIYRVNEVIHTCVEIKK